MEDELLAMMLALTEAVSRKAKRGSLKKTQTHRFSTKRRKGEEGLCAHRERSKPRRKTSSRPAGDEETKERERDAERH